MSAVDVDCRLPGLEKRRQQRRPLAESSSVSFLSSVVVAVVCLLLHCRSLSASATTTSSSSSNNNNSSNGLVQDGITHGVSLIENANQSTIDHTSPYALEQTSTSYSSADQYVGNASMAAVEKLTTSAQTAKLTTTSEASVELSDNFTTMSFAHQSSETVPRLATGTESSPSSRVTELPTESHLLTGTNVENNVSYTREMQETTEKNSLGYSETSGTQTTTEFTKSTKLGSNTEQTIGSNLSTTGHTTSAVETIYASRSTAPQLNTSEDELRNGSSAFTSLSSTVITGSSLPQYNQSGSMTTSSEFLNTASIGATLTQSGNSTDFPTEKPATLNYTASPVASEVFSSSSVSFVTASTSSPSSPFTQGVLESTRESNHSDSSTVNQTVSLTTPSLPFGTNQESSVSRTLETGASSSVHQFFSTNTKSTIDLDTHMGSVVTNFFLTTGAEQGAHNDSTSFSSTSSHVQQTSTEMNANFTSERPFSTSSAFNESSSSSSSFTFTSVSAVTNFISSTVPPPPSTSSFTSSTTSNSSPTSYTTLAVTAEKSGTFSRVTTAGSQSVHAAQSSPHTSTVYFSSAAGPATSHQVPVTSQVPAMTTLSVTSSQNAKTTATYSVNATSGLLYVSNDTDIMSVSVADGIVTSIIHQSDGNIVALAIDSRLNEMFWANNGLQWKGLYRANIDGTSPQLITSTDILEVNGLTLDQSAQYIYWTDAQRRRIEMVDYRGVNRRVVVYTDLLQPRGIAVDPLSGWLYWNDQGTKRIERIRLDGTQRQRLVTENVTWPNQMTLVRAANQSNTQLYWLDGWDQTLNYVTAAADHVSDVTVMSLRQAVGSLRVVYGLAVTRSQTSADTTAYVSVWNSAELIEVDLTTSTVRSVATHLGNSVLFSVAVSQSLAAYDAIDNNPCRMTSSYSHDCSHICLTMGGASYQCTCPTFGALVIGADNKTCHVPDYFLLYADSLYGHVGLIDVEGNPERYLDLHLIAYSERPVGIAYDPVNQRVYWSDVKLRTITSSKLDGTNQTELIGSSQGLGFVEGLVIDSISRRLYFTNDDSAVVGGVTYSWQRIEVVGLDGRQRRAIVTSGIEKPRGLAIDAASGKLYYTDWGVDAKLVRSNLDGTEPTVLLRGLSNPNSVAVDDSDGTIYVVDSRVDDSNNNSSHYPVVYVSGDNAMTWSIRSLPQLAAPFGIAVTTTSTYISDWYNGTVAKYASLLGGSAPFVTSAQLGQPAAIAFCRRTPETNDTGAAKSDTCRTANCSDICMTSANWTVTCSCPTHAFNVLSSDLKNCIAPPVSYALIADMNAVGMIGLDDVTDRSVYTVVYGEFYNSYTAITFDVSNNVIYYSDVNSGMISMTYLSQVPYTNDVIPIFSIGLVVEDLLIYDNHLYVTASDAGLIARLDIASLNANYDVIISSLSSPRALAIDSSSGWLYWSELNGTHSTVKRSRLNGTDVYLVTSMINTPNALYLDVTNSSDSSASYSLYVLDGVNGTLFDCRLENYTNGQADCRVVEMLPGVGPFFGLSVIGRLVYFTDWGRASLTRYNLDLKTTEQLVAGLQRPTRFVIQQQQAAYSATSQSPEVNSTTVMTTSSAPSQFTSTTNSSIETASNVTPTTENSSSTAYNLITEMTTYSNSVQQDTVTMTTTLTQNLSSLTSSTEPEMSNNSSLLSTTGVTQTSEVSTSGNFQTSPSSAVTFFNPETSATSLTTSVSSAYPTTAEQTVANLPELSTAGAAGPSSTSVEPNQLTTSSTEVSSTTSQPFTSSTPESTSVSTTITLTTEPSSSTATETQTGISTSTTMIQSAIMSVTTLQLLVTSANAESSTPTSMSTQPIETTEPSEQMTGVTTTTAGWQSTAEVERSSSPSTGTSETSSSSEGTSSTTMSSSSSMPASTGYATSTEGSSAASTTTAVEESSAPAATSSEESSPSTAAVAGELSSSTTSEQQSTVTMTPFTTQPATTSPTSVPSSPSSASTETVTTAPMTTTQFVETSGTSQRSVEVSSTEEFSATTAATSTPTTTTVTTTAATSGPITSETSTQTATTNNTTEAETSATTSQLMTTESATTAAASSSLSPEVSSVTSSLTTATNGLSTTQTPPGANASTAQYTSELPSSSSESPTAHSSSSELLLTSSSQQIETTTEEMTSSAVSTQAVTSEASKVATSMTSLGTSLALESTAGIQTTTAVPIIPTTGTTAAQAPRAVFKYCPPDITVVTNQPTAVVWWRDPVVDSPVSVLKEPSIVSASAGPGGSFQTGTTTVVYEVDNVQGQPTYCTFYVTVQTLDIQCSNLPQPVNGWMNCVAANDAGSVTYACSLTCNPGYVPANGTDVTTHVCSAANKYTWDPPIDEEQPYICLEDSLPSKQSVTQLLFNGTCLQDISLQDQFMQSLSAGLFENSACLAPVSSSVGPAGKSLADICDVNNYVISCASSNQPARKKREANPMSLAMILYVPNSDASLSAAVASSLARLQQLVLSGQLLVSVASSGTVYRGSSFNTALSSTSGCPTYWQTSTVAGQTICVACSDGAFYSTLDGLCLSCEAGSYQPDTSRITCLSCPAGTSSPAGAFNVAQCTSPVVQSTSSSPLTTGSTSSYDQRLAIIIGVSVGGGVLIIVAVVLLILLVIYCRRRRKHLSFEMPDNNHGGRMNGGGQSNHGWTDDELHQQGSDNDDNGSNSVPDEATIPVTSRRHEEAVPAVSIAMVAPHVIRYVVNSSAAPEGRVTSSGTWPMMLTTSVQMQTKLDRSRVTWSQLTRPFSTPLGRSRIPAKRRVMGRAATLWSGHQPPSQTAAAAAAAAAAASTAQQTMASLERRVEPNVTSFEEAGTSGWQRRTSVHSTANARDQGATSGQFRRLPGAVATQLVPLHPLQINELMPTNSNAADDSNLTSSNQVIRADNPQFPVSQYPMAVVRPTMSTTRQSASEYSTSSTLDVGQRSPSTIEHEHLPPGNDEILPHEQTTLI